MTRGSSVNILHWFVAVVVWQTGPWGTFHISEGTFSTITMTRCVLANTQSYQCISLCTEDHWVHIVSKKFQAGCDPTNPSYTLQTNTAGSLTVSCAGRQQSSASCSGCLEHVTAPDTYSGNNTFVTLNGECIDESAIYNLCADLSNTTTNLLYLASPSLFAPGPSPLNRCRCEIHAQHPAQVEILFADISTSMFTITCGQLIVSDGNFTTNVTNTVMSLPVSSTDCVIEVDQRGAETTDGLPPHRVWTKFTGSSLTFHCNASSPGTSTSTTPLTTKMATSRQTSSLLSTTSTVSSSPIVTVTISRQTSELPTTPGATPPGGVTSLQTSDTLVVTQDSGDTGVDASTRYIIAGACVGVVVLIAAVVVTVFFIRRSKTIYDSLGPRVPHSPGVQTGDADHLYDVLQPVGMSSLQHSATAGEDNQRVHSSQQLNVQDPNGRDEEAVVPTSHTQAYENMGMTLLTEAGSEPCQSDPQSNNGPPTVHL